MRTRRVVVAFVALCVLLGGGTDPAQAQAGPGAQRYEVTITPPKRPGTEPPAMAVPGEGNAARVTQETAGDPDAEAATNGAAAASSGANSSETKHTPAAIDSGSAAAATAAQPATASASAPAGPPHSLQVGAFRRQRSADDLQRKLAATFPDVVVVEVLSGGDPLYRVYVGRVARGPQLDALKRELLATGHASFEVPAPPTD
jgi:cell division protein FtsN